jgi:hypothetical protein
MYLKQSCNIFKKDNEAIKYIKFLFKIFFFINFDFNYFYLCYRILDVKYMNELSFNFKCIFVDINFIKYYIIHTKIFKVKVEEKNSKSQM